MGSVRRVGGLLIAVAFVAACDNAPVTAPDVQTSEVPSVGCNSGDCAAAPAAVAEGEVGGSLPGPARSPAAVSTASITAIPNPDAAYVGSTALIDISTIPNTTTLGSITDGLQTVTFSTAMSKRHAEVSGWATWGDPPFTEVFAPHILYTQGASSLTMSLSLPTPTFGFELEPNPFSTITFTADFYSNGGTVLEGSVTRSVAGFHGARLFAATSTGAPIDRVVVSGGSDFAIARVRYTPRIHVDAELKPGADPAPIKLGSRGMIPAAILTTASFDAATVDASTVTLGDDDGNDTPVASKPNGSLFASLEDVDGDGDLDLALKFRQPALEANGDLHAGTTELFLNGQTTGGVPIHGSHAVQVIP